MGCPTLLKCVILKTSVSHRREAHLGGAVSPKGRKSHRGAGLHAMAKLAAQGASKREGLGLGLLAVKAEFSGIEMGLLENDGPNPIAIYETSGKCVKPRGSERSIVLQKRASRFDEVQTSEIRRGQVINNNICKS